MSQTNLKEKLVNDFAQYEASLNGAAQSDLHQIRKTAINSFDALGFPTIKQEDWKYTNLSAISKTSFDQPLSSFKSETEIDLTKLLIPNLEASLLVFENGVYRKDLSSIKKQDKGIIVSNLKTAFESSAELIVQHYTKYADHKNEALVALNTGLAQDGLFVYVPKSGVVQHPVYVLHIANTKGNAVLSSPRNLIIGEANSQVKVIQHYVSLDNSGASFSNTVTEIVGNEKAIIENYIVQDENENATNITETQSRLSKESYIYCHNYSLEGGLIRNKTNMVVVDEHSEAHMYGAYVLNENQHADNRSLVDHNSANTYSQELYKGVLGGKSKGVFNGRIMVRRDAQKTNAYQTNRNILVSDNAQVFTKPQLEIFADDVRCSHGCTIGQLDEDAIFYLRSRGLSLQKAKTYLLKAFVGEVVLKVTIDSLKDFLIEKIDGKIQGMMV